MISSPTNIVTFWKLLEGSCAYLIMHTYFFAKTIILFLHLILMLFCRNGGVFFKMVSFDQDPYLIFKQK